MSYDLMCWHLLVIRKNRNVCGHCGVEIVPCICVEWDASARYTDMHKQIQSSIEASMLASMLISMGDRVPLHVLLCIAFSHGVVVGCEMEKQELL